MSFKNVWRACLLILFYLIFFASITHAATIYTTASSDTGYTFRTNVNSSLTNLNAALGAATTTSNSWNALQLFNVASTSQFSVFKKAYFGGSATTTIDSTGAITVAATSANTFPYASTTALTVGGSSYLGTVMSGTWTGSVIGSSYGGAGAVNGILKANGSGTVSAASNGSDYTLVAGTTCSAGDFVSAVSASGVVTCTTPVSTSGQFPFTTTTYGGTTVNATSTPLWLKASTPFSLIASSSLMTYASSTALTTSGTAYIGTLSLTNGLGLASGGTGATSFTTSGNALYYTGSALATAPLTSAITIPYASTTVLSSSGTSFFDSLKTTNNATIGGTLFSALTEGGSASNSTLTLQSTGGSGTTDAIIFNVGNAGAVEAGRITTKGLWSGLQASTTKLSAYGPSYFGATATTTIDSTGAITIASTNKNTFPYASSTALTAPALYSTNSSLTSASTTNLSAGSSSYMVNPLNALPVTIASSTWGTGTTTVTLLGTTRAVTFVDISCPNDFGLFLGVDVYYGSTHLNYLISSSTQNTVVFTSNNVIAAGSKILMDIGTSTAPASGLKKFNCTPEWTYNSSS